MIGILVTRQTHGYDIRFRKLPLQTLQGVEIIHALRLPAFAPLDSHGTAAQCLHLPGNMASDIAHTVTSTRLP